MLRRFHKDELIRKQVSPDDARQTFLSMTARGRKAFAPLEAHARRLAPCWNGSPARAGSAGVGDGHGRDAAGAEADPKPGFILREPRAGDYGWIVTRHAVLYAQEYGWTENFEGLCAQIVADFLNNFDPKYERAWIAERDGAPVGSMLLAKDTLEVARLRLLLVEPSARGLGIGNALTDACIGFARERGYRRITLWTHRVLTARAPHLRARRLPPHLERGAQELGPGRGRRALGLLLAQLHVSITASACP